MNFVNSVLWGVAQIFCIKESSDWAVHNFVISYMDGPIVFCGGTVHEISIGALYSIFWAVWADFCGRIVPLGERGPKISDQT